MTEGASTYSVSWFCNACGERWTEDADSEQCSATENCPGVPVGIAFYKGPVNIDDVTHTVEDGHAIPVKKDIDEDRQ